MAIAPALTIGFIVRSSLSSIGHHRVERQAGAVDAEAGPRLVGADRVAHEREHERLRHALDRERVVGVAEGEDVARGVGQAGAEEVGRRRGPARGCSRRRRRRRRCGTARSPRAARPRRRAGAGSRPVETWSSLTGSRGWRSARGRCRSRRAISGPVTGAPPYVIDEPDTTTSTFVPPMVSSGPVRRSAVASAPSTARSRRNASAAAASVRSVSSSSGSRAANASLVGANTVSGPGWRRSLPYPAARATSISVDISGISARTSNSGCRSGSGGAVVGGGSVVGAAVVGGGVGAGVGSGGGRRRRRVRRRIRTRVRRSARAGAPSRPRSLAGRWPGRWPRRARRSRARRGRAGTPARPRSRRPSSARRSARRSSRGRSAPAGAASWSRSGSPARVPRRSRTAASVASSYSPVSGSPRSRCRAATASARGVVVDAGDVAVVVAEDAQPCCSWATNTAAANRAWSLGRRQVDVTGADRLELAVDHLGGRDAGRRDVAGGVEVEATGRAVVVDVLAGGEQRRCSGRRSSRSARRRSPHSAHPRSTPGRSSRSRRRRASSRSRSRRPGRRRRVWSSTAATSPRRAMRRRSPVGPITRTPSAATGVARERLLGQPGHEGAVEADDPVGRGPVPDQLGDQVRRLGVRDEDHEVRRQLLHLGRLGRRT